MAKKTPKRRHGRGGGLNKAPQRKKADNQAAFLAAYAETGNISRAALAARVDRTLHYLWLDGDEAYRTRFSDAQERAIELLEEEARRRAFHGLRRLKFHQGKAITDPQTGEPYTELEYSDTLLIFLLKALRPNTYRERLEVKHDGEVHIKRIILEDPAGHAPGR
jgi:hypothetical protein